MIKLVILTIPPTLGAAMASCMVLLCISPIFFPEITAMATAIVTTPIPPICIISKIINCPKPDQYVAVSCTASPVTQVAEVAVKMASKKEAPFPSLVAKGSISIKLPAKITSKNPNIII